MSTVDIIGMSCQFPGAGDISSYWRLIKENLSAIGPPPADRLHFVRQVSELNIPANGGYIDHLNVFDSRRFNIPEREAALMDPQHKLVLSNACNAIEDAGLAVSDMQGSRTGVFVGAMANDLVYLSWHDVAKVDVASVTGNGLCLIANRLSYELDFYGPSMAIDSACSSSLVALHQACRSLRDDECDFAIVAGVNVILSGLLQKFYRDAGVGAPDGRCKSFSSTADGIGRSDGIGVILLRRSQDRHIDKRRVYATVSGGSVNNGGQSSRFTAPNIKAQIDLLQKAYSVAKVSINDLSYIEGHGTGTLQGDYMEVSALKHVFKGRSSPCPLGSVKSLISHSEAASGAAGLIKVALMLHNRHIPKSMYADSPTQWLDELSPVQLISDARELDAHLNHHMGVSSFGLGGTNAHVVLSSYVETV